DENRLVVLLGLLILLTAEPAEEGIGPLAGLSQKRELRFLAGNANEPHELHFVVFIHRAAEKLEFPVGTPRHIKDAVRPTAAIDSGNAAVVDNSRFVAPAGVVGQTFFSLQERLYGIEADSRMLRTQKKPLNGGLAVGHVAHDPA